MAQERRKKWELIEDVLTQVKSEPKTASEISNLLNTNWNSVIEVLNFLKKIGKVESFEDKQITKYFIKINKVSKIPTFFNLPVDEEIIKFAGYVFFKICELWDKKFDRSINASFLQKIAVNVFDNPEIKEKFFKVPVGWYRFGKISIFGVRGGLDDFSSYDSNQFNQNPLIQKVISASFEEYQEYKNTNQLTNQQYLKYNKVEYLIKKQLDKLSLTLVDIKKNKDVIIDDLNIIISRLPDNKKGLANVKVRFMEFRDILIDLFGSNLDPNQLRGTIYDAYSRLWDLLAIHNLYHSLLGEEFYEERVLDEYMNSDITEKFLTADLFISELRQEINRRKENR